MVNTEIRLIIFLQPKMEKLYTVSINKTGSWLWLRSVQFSSVAQSCTTSCDPMKCSQASLSTTNSQGLPKLMSIESVIPSNHLILHSPLLLLPPIFPSIRVFSNESTVCIRWPKYWSFSFNISPSNEHPGMISFRRDWLDLLEVQGTLKSLLQHHSSKASILWCSASIVRCWLLPNRNSERRDQPGLEQSWKAFQMARTFVI